MSEPIIRTLRKSDYPALIDVVRRMWYPEYDEKTGLLAAETDWENCLARATCAFTAELDGKPIALILGRIDALDHRGFLNTHRINSLQMLFKLAFAKDGLKAARDILGILGVDRNLRAQATQAGHDYSAEVVLFVIDPIARSHGLGRRMFETMMDSFRAAGVREYFLFTDTTCDVGFYTHRGLIQVCEHTLAMHGDDERATSFYLYEGLVPEK